MKKFLLVLIFAAPVNAETPAEIVAKIIQEVKAGDPSTSVERVVYHPDGRIETFFRDSKVQAVSPVAQVQSLMTQAPVTYYQEQPVQYQQVRVGLFGRTRIVGGSGACANGTCSRGN